MAVVQRSCVHFAKRCGSVNDVDKLRRRLQRTPERTWRPRRGYHAARGSRRCGLRSLVRCDLDFERQRHVGWRGALAGANPDGGVRDRIFDCGKTRDQYVCQILDTDRRCGWSAVGHVHLESDAMAARLRVQDFGDIVDESVGIARRGCRFQPDQRAEKLQRPRGARGPPDPGRDERCRILHKRAGRRETLGDQLQRDRGVVDTAVRPMNEQVLRPLAGLMTRTAWFARCGAFSHGDIGWSRDGRAPAVS